MKLAYQLATSDKKLKVALDELKANFWAPSSKASREVKRGEVARVWLAKLVAKGEEEVFPLSKSVVEGVAACLKAAGLKSGDQYLNELKICHLPRRKRA